jgi:SPP1 gp7 family putative phage head morphogenesis protein
MQQQRSLNRRQAKLRLAARLWMRRPARLRKLGPAPAIPHGPEQAYVLALRQFSRHVSHAIQQTLGDLSKLTHASAIRIHVAPPLDAARRMLRATDAANKQAMNAHLRPLTGGIDLWSERAVRADAARMPAVAKGASPRVQAVLRERFSKNIQLIKSIQSEQLNDVQDVLEEHLARGSRVEVIQAALDERFDISERRAELIARDQVGKLNGQLVEERMREIGIRDYIWRTSGGGTPEHGDERVRAGHRVLDGKKQSFDDPPVVDPKSGRTANPGEDFQCRCTAEADVYGYLDSIGA